MQARHAEESARLLEQVDRAELEKGRAEGDVLQLQAQVQALQQARVQLERDCQEQQTTIAQLRLLSSQMKEQVCFPLHSMVVGGRHGTHHCVP